MIPTRRSQPKPRHPINNFTMTGLISSYLRARLTPIASAAVLAASMLAGCTPTPKGVVPPDDMAELLADIHTGESVVEIESRTFNSDSMRMTLKQSILAKHGVTSEQFDSSLMWYGKHIDIYSSVYEDVVKILEKRISKAEQNGDATYAQPSVSNENDMNFYGDSVDVWSGMRSMVFSSKSPTLTIPFSMPANQNWETGDVYTLRARLVNATSQAFLSMAVEYNDGSIDYITTRSMGNGWKTIRLFTDSVRHARSIYGHITYLPMGNEVVYLDSVTLVRKRHETGNRPDMGQKSLSSRFRY